MSPAATQFCRAIHRACAPRSQALLAQVQDDYENVRVPGPRNPNRKPAD